MKSPENGTAELKARHPLNCEAKENYILTIAAVACNGQISERYVVTVVQEIAISHKVLFISHVIQLSHSYFREGGQMKEQVDPPNLKLNY